MFAIPDHPWVDSAEGAAVRIAMTVGAAGEHTGELLEVSDEDDIADDGTAHVFFSPAKQGRISADLTVGADVAGANPLKANDLLAGTGLILGGRGFVITAGEAESFINRNPACESLIGPLFNGEDINGTPRGCCVIDPQGWAEDDLRAQVPEIYQHLFTTVYPERQQNRDPKLRKNWWLFRRSNDLIRSAIEGLPRFIATVETSKHRMFIFLPAKAKPEHKLVVIGSDDAFHLGILSSRIHVTYALAAGGWLGVGNDPVYSKTRCFDPFPFPLCDEATKERIRSLAEQLDAHRKRVQAQHPGLTLTGMYNVLEKLRADQPLTDKEKLFHDQGLVSVLKQLHDDLDAAVFAAYGWQHLWDMHLAAATGERYNFKTGAVELIDCGPEDFGPGLIAWERELDAEILQRLVTLNAQRAEEEKRGIIHWLRPDYQKQAGKSPSSETAELPLKPKKGRKAKSAPTQSKVSNPKSKIVWPKSLADRIRAVEQALHTTSPTTAEALSKSFSRAKPADVQEILESLVALGRARKDGERFSV